MPDEMPPHPVYGSDWPDDPRNVTAKEETVTDQVIRVPTPDVDKCEECGKPITMGDHVAYIIEKDGITHRYRHKECLDASGTPIALHEAQKRIAELEEALRAIYQRGAHMSVGPAADMASVAREALGHTMKP